MRHRNRGRKLGRNASHRTAMFRNMASSLIRSVDASDEPGQPKVAGRIVTTVAKAKELRPIVEKLVTMARKAVQHEEAARQYATDADRNSAEWKQWRESDQWRQWNQAIAPAVALRRRAFAALRDPDAVSILFDELGERFLERQGGYTRVVRLATVRLGDAGPQALIEFVGDDRDRVRTKKRTAPVVADEPGADESTETEAAPQAEAESAETAEAPADETSASEEEKA